MQLVVGSRCLGREYRLQRAFQRVLELVEGDGLGAQYDFGLCDGGTDLPVSGQFLGCLDDQTAEVLEEECFAREHIVECETNVVTNGHLADSLGYTADRQCPSGYDLARMDEVGDLLPDGLDGLIIGCTVRGVRCVEQVDRMTGCLELGRDQVGCLFGCDCEGNQRGRNVHVVERAGHGVLTADCSQTQLFLCLVRAEQGGQRLAETVRIAAQTLEVFLEGQVSGLVVTASSDQLGNRLNNRSRSAKEGILLGVVGIEAEGHNGRGRALTVQCGQGSCHDLCRGQLILAAEGHEDRVCTDRAVKTLGQAALQADAERGHLMQNLLARGVAVGQVCSVRDGHCGNNGIGMLCTAVGVKEVTGNVRDHLAVPGHAQTIEIGDLCDNDSLQVFACSGSDEGVYVLGTDNDCHTLLRLGDGQLGAVQTVVLLGYCVEVDVQTVSQLTDRNRYTAGTKVVAAANHAGDLGVTEQTLQLALLGRVALLNFCTASLEGSLGVLLGRTGCTAAAIAAGLTAEQDDDIARLGYFTDDVLNRSRADNCADLHALCNIARMVEFVYQAGCKTDLVAVRGVTSGSRGAQLALGQLVGQGLGQRNGRVTGTGYAHCLIDIGTTGQRVTDGAAKAGSRTAEGFDLGRMVVGLVLEHEQPFLGLAVHLNGDLDRAGVDLLGLVEVLEVAALFEYLCGSGCDVHEGDRTLCSLFFAVYFDAGSHIAVVSFLYHRIFKGHVVDLGEEGGVAAVVRPVGVDHTYLGDGRVAMLLVAEVGLEEGQVIEIHRKTERLLHLVQGSGIHVDEALNRCDLGRDLVNSMQGLGLVHRGLAGFDGVDEVTADLVQISIRQLALEHIDLCGSDDRTLALSHQLDALCAGIGALVELTGQGLDSQNGVCILGRGERLVVAHVGHRLGEYDVLGLGIDCLVHALDIIAAQIAHAGQGFDLQKIVQAVKQTVRLDVKAGTLLGITTINCHFGLLHAKSGFCSGFRRLRPCRYWLNNQKITGNSGNSY